MAALDPRIAEALALLPEYLSAHVVLSLSALALGLAVSLPLGLAAVRFPRLGWLLLGFAGVIQTIPSLALLALFYPLLLALSALAKVLIGVQFSALGFLPSLLALTLYSMLPILRNIVTGIEGVAPAVKEAAQGVGMTPGQSLIQVELPLAAPIIMAGIRTASVWVIGAATLSTPVGQTSLGNYIFTGLQTQNWIFVLFGCVAAASLALLCDAALSLAERLVARRRRAPLAVVGGGFVLLLLVLLLAPLMQTKPAYVVGAKGFAEQYVLAALIGQRLNAAGFATTTRGDLGSAVIFNALVAGDIDAYVDYSGTLWTNTMHRTDTPPRAAMLKELGAYLQDHYGVTMLGALGFENAYALAMRRDRAAALGLKTIGDLPSMAPRLSVGGDYEIFSRPEWRAIRSAYGLTFRQERVMQPEFMYKAVADGEVDLITAFSSDGQIAQYDLILLDDTKQAIPPYDAVLLLAPKRRGDARLADTLRPLVGRISIARMREANLETARKENQIPPAEAARRLARAVSGASPSE